MMFKHAALCAALAVAAAGCASTTTTGRTANMANVGQLEVGVTTLADAERLLGKPTQVTRTDQGTVMSYVRTEVRSRGFLGSSADVDSDVFTLFFGADGKLTRYGDTKQHVPINR